MELTKDQIKDYQTRKGYVIITKLFSKGDNKNYIGYDKKGNAYDVQTYVNVAHTPRYKHGGRGPTISHPYAIITQGKFAYSWNSQKEVYDPDKSHFILDIK